MAKINKLISIAGILAALFYPISSLAECQTTEICSPGTECSCVIPASSGHERYYYWKFPGLIKGINYTCDFKDSMSRVVLDSYEFTERLQYKFSGKYYPRFPLKLNLNTDKMQDKTGYAKIKILVTASDWPTTVTMSCMPRN